MNCQPVKFLHYRKYSLSLIMGVYSLCQACVRCAANQKMSLYLTRKLFAHRMFIQQLSKPHDPGQSLFHLHQVRSVSCICNATAQNDIHRKSDFVNFHTSSKVANETSPKDVHGPEGHGEQIQSNPPHKPVLMAEVLEFLNPKPGGVSNDNKNRY